MTTEFFSRLFERYQGRQRDALLPLLWEIQSAFGSISPEAVRAVSQMLRIPEAEIYGVIEFYTLFHTTPTGKRIIRVCTDPMCGLTGADRLLEQTCAQVGLSHSGVSADGQYTIEHSPCLGMCDHAPAALISQPGKRDFVLSSVASVDALLHADESGGYHTISGGQPAVLLAGIDSASADMQTLIDYGDYAVLRHALNTMTREQVIDVVKTSGLVGRGGAAFPAGIKWEGTLSNRQKNAHTPHYVVCNADESEPGTFKDRVLLEQRPHLLLEGMLLCGYAVDAAKGYIFIRGEYPLALERLQAAIDEARSAGLLGDHLFGSAFSFDVEIRRGAGAYICGEETALLEAMEGKRGFPRIKPPFPTQHGLFGCPTTINNVETLCCVPGILQHGAAWFRATGTEKSSGSKLVSVSGHVQRPGVYEIAPGITLRTLIEEVCGGIVGELQAILMGGASGTFLTPADMDVKLTFEDLRAAGSTFGSGAVMVFNNSVDLRDVLQRLGRFFQHESCGKCFPCQLGTQRQMEILARSAAPLPGDRARLQDVGWTMTESSLCGLGQTAASAVLSALAKFPSLWPAEGYPHHER